MFLANNCSTRKLKYFGYNDSRYSITSFSRPKSSSAGNSNLAINVTPVPIKTNFRFTFSIFDSQDYFNVLFSSLSSASMNRALILIGSKLRDDAISSIFSIIFLPLLIFNSSYRSFLSMQFSQGKRTVDIFTSIIYEITGSM